MPSLSSFGMKKDFPAIRVGGFLLSLFSIYILYPVVDYFVPTPYYALTNRDTGEDFIVFTELAIWILILMLMVIFLTLTFIIPLTLHFRGVTKWEWDPNVLALWLIVMKSLSIFFGEIERTNSNISEIFLFLITITDSIFVLLFTYFILKVYSTFLVPIMSARLSVGKSDTQYGPLLDIIGSIIIIVLGLTNFLSTFNVEFGVLIAGVGVVGLVFALAAQDTLSNFFSGILLLLDQGFKTGDMIRFNDTYCLIRDIGLRSTKLYDIINHVIIIIPNNSLANQDIQNLTKPDRYYRLRILVGVSYSTDPDQVEKALIEVAKENKDVEQDDPTRKPLVRFQRFGDSTLDFALVVWIKNVIKLRQINSDLHHQVFKKLEGEGIVIAFPQRDVHLFTSSDQPVEKIIKSKQPSLDDYQNSSGDTSASIDSSTSSKLVDEEKARQIAEESAKLAEEELKKAEESAMEAEIERAKLEVELAEKQIEEAAKEAEEAAKKAEEENSKKAEEEAKRAEEAAKRAEEEKAKLEAEEAARKAEAEEAKMAEEERVRKAEEEKAKLEAEEAARKAEEEKARFKADEAVRFEEEKKAKLEAEEAAKIAAEKKAKLEAEEAETRKLIEEIKARQAEAD